MNKLLIIPLAVVGFFAALIIPQLLQAGYYGVAGGPQVILDYPVCNSTVSQEVNFRWTPQPSAYDHYLLQVKVGGSWDASNFIAATVTATNYLAMLVPGVYMYNVIAFNELNETRAGSGPCEFTVQ